MELAAKPKLLLFLDEPTSGLDSQTAWSICTLLRDLANNGQAILCTIHQPSALLFQEFDRLLFLARGGRTVYFGDIGENSKTLTSYFERQGASPCPPDANPAEWMLQVIGAAPGAVADRDYADAWRQSDDYIAMKKELSKKRELSQSRPQPSAQEKRKSKDYSAFSASFQKQFQLCLYRVFQQLYRTPSYIYSKTFLSVTTVSVLESPTVVHRPLTCFAVPFHWLHILQSGQHTPRSPKPDVLCLHAHDDLWKLGQSDHASFCHSTLSL